MNKSEHPNDSEQKLKGFNYCQLFTRCAKNNLSWMDILMSVMDGHKFYGDGHKNTINFYMLFDTYDF